MEKDKIEVGEYVRTKNKGIKKIDHLAINPNVTVNKYRYFLGVDKEGDRCYGILKTIDILKHSKSIKDLLETGDIVKGKDNHFFEVYAVGSDCVYINNLEEFICIEDIKEIVTKEQIQEMGYKI